MSKFLVMSDSCEICAKEYIKTETDKLVGFPNNQQKTARINQIIHSALKASTKPVVKLPCRENLSNAYHTFCKDHVYQMADAIEEYIDDCNDPAMP